MPGRADGLPVAMHIAQFGPSRGSCQAALPTIEAASIRRLGERISRSATREDRGDAIKEVRIPMRHCSRCERADLPRSARVSPGAAAV
jgi:hypothetical protein